MFIPFILLHYSHHLLPQRFCDLSFFHVDDNSQGLKKSYASINNLEPNTNYRFLISAVNSVGNNRKLGHANMLPCLTRDATTPGLGLNLLTKYKT